MNDTYWISEEDYHLWTSRIEARPGDCVITNVGRVGAVSQIPFGTFAALGRNMTAVRTKSNYGFPTFLIECLLSSAMRQEIESKVDSGTILDSLNVRNIPKLRLVLPSIPVVERFEKLCRPLRHRMERNQAESCTLAAIRDTLLPKLISGEIRVKDAERFLQSQQD
jgi:type I restriction enzyme S subunit